MRAMGEPLTLKDFTEVVDCSGRRRFSKRKRPAAIRIDWCPWCRQLLKGTDGGPVKAALEASNPPLPTQPISGI